MYDFETLGKTMSFNPIMFDLGSGKNPRLIVPTADIRNRLASFIDVRLQNVPAAEMALQKTKQLIPDIYRTAEDFTRRPGTLIFTSRESVEQWLRDKKAAPEHRKVYSYLRPRELTSKSAGTDEGYDPYFYHSTFIRKGRLALVQNVLHEDEERAILVSKKWIEDKINIGHNPTLRISEIGANVSIYTEKGLVSGSGLPNTIPIIQYEQTSFAALLFL